MRRIYKYYTSEDDSNYTLHETQIYKNGDILLEPALPTREDGKCFIGWYTGSGEQHLSGEGTHASIVFDEPITDIDETATEDEVVEVHAHFSTEVIVRFYNASFTDVIDIEEGEAHTQLSLSGPAPQMTSSERHIGWLLVNSEGNPVNASGSVLANGNALYEGNDFTGDLSGLTWYEPDDTITLGTEKIYLRAIIGNSYKLEFFENNGSNDVTRASYTEPVYVPTGSTAKDYMPADPAREGYEFAGWFFDSDCTNAFDDTKVTSVSYASKADASGVIRLYAGWEAQETTYDVYIWREILTNGRRDVNNKRYEAVLFYTGDSAYTGVSGEEAEWTDALKAAFEASPDEVSSRDNDKAFDHRYYEFNASKTKPVTVRGDGSSILNVYYDLKEFTMTFDPIGVQTVNKQTTTFYAQFETGGVTYTHDNPFSIPVVLGQYVGDVWPNPSDITITGVNYNGTLDLSTYLIISWKTEKGFGTTATNQSQYLGVRTYVVKKNISTYNGVPGNHLITVMAYAKNKTVFVNKRAFLEDENGEYRERAEYSYNGLVPTGVTPTVANVIGYTMVREEKVGGTGTETDPDEYDCYFDRIVYTVTLHNYNDVYENTEIRYGEAIPTNDYTAQSAASPALTDVSAPPVPTGLNDHYVFKGWYLNRAYTMPFSFEDAVMEEENITLYAKWEPKDITITFDAGEGSFAADAGDISNRITLEDPVTVNNETRYKTAKVTAKAGDTLDAIVPKTPSCLRHTFRDWLYTDAFGTTRVDFTQREFADDTTLHASWQDDEEVTVYYFEKEADARALDPAIASTTDRALEIFAGGERSRNYRYGAHLALLWETDNDQLLSTYTDNNGVEWTFVGWRAVGSGLTTYLPGELISIDPGKSMIRLFDSETSEGVDTIAFYAVYESVAGQKTSITCYSNYPSAFGYAEETYVIDKDNMTTDTLPIASTGALIVNHETKAPEVTVFTNGSAVSGYVFVGWNTAADGSGLLLMPGKSIAADQNGTNALYAQWIKKTSDVTHPVESTTEVHAVDEGHGKIVTDVHIDNSVPVSRVVGLTADLALDELTDDELVHEVYQDGDTARIWLDIEPESENQVPVIDTQMIYQAASFHTDNAHHLLTGEGHHAGLVYMDISLHKTVTDTAGHVVEDNSLEFFGDTGNGTTNGQDHYDGNTVAITVDVPQDVILEDPEEGTVREYAMFRVHEYHGTAVDGKKAGKQAEQLVAWTTATDLTFETGLFSTYALAWRDVEVASSVATAAATMTSTGSIQTQEDASASDTQPVATSNLYDVSAMEVPTTQDMELFSAGQEVYQSRIGVATSDDVHLWEHMTVLYFALSLMLLELLQLHRKGKNA